jgi:hypothetical protein
MACVVCDRAKGVHCAVGRELAAAVRDAFGPMVDWVGKTGEKSITRTERYEQARERYRAHVDGEPEV